VPLSLSSPPPLRAARQRCFPKGRRITSAPPPVTLLQPLEHAFRYVPPLVPTASGRQGRPVISLWDRPFLPLWERNSPCHSHCRGQRSPRQLKSDSTPRRLEAEDRRWGRRSLSGGPYARGCRSLSCAGLWAVLRGGGRGPPHVFFANPHIALRPRGHVVVGLFQMLG
jgi:hypothetical protein